MAPRNEEEVDLTEDYQRTDRWVDFTVGPGTLDLAPQPIMPGAPSAVPGATGSPAGEMVGIGEPEDFDENFPIERPDVPDIEDELPPEANQGGILGGFRQFMDNIWFDDLGGNLRGESGWLANIPLYEETVGNVFDVALTSGSAAIDAIDYGSQQLGRLITAAVSAAPGGIQTLTWEETEKVSTMQAAIASVGLESKRIREGGFRPSDILLFNAVTGPFILAGYAASDSPIQQEGFDILDQEAKDAVFSQGWERFFSGLGDAGVRVGTDPLIILGGGSSVLRHGTKAGKFGGLSNQQLRTSGQVDRFGSTLDDQARLIEELGVDGARQSGRLTNEGENLIRALQNNAAGNANHVWVKNSNNERAIQDLLGRTSIDNPREAATVVGALAGRRQSWVDLRQTNPQLYDDVAMANGFDLATSLPRAENIGKIEFVPNYSDDTLKLFDDIVKQAEGASALPTAMGAGGQVITRGGSRTRTTPLVRAANAWRQGGARTQFVRKPFGGAENSSTVGKNGGWVYDFIEGTSASRPITAVRWVGRSTPAGVLFLKGQDLRSSNREWSAWLRKSPLEKELANDFYVRYVAAKTVQARTKIVDEAEEAVVATISAKNGLNPANARKLYDGYRARRSYALRQSRSTDSHFYIDDQTGELVKVPSFYAEVDQAVPLLDVKMFNRVARDNKTWLRSAEDVTIASDYVNSLWKISVLLRLGYTQRNVVEGALRSFAALGMIAANPQAWGRAFTNAPYALQSRKAKKLLKTKEKFLMDKYNELEESKKILVAARSKAGVDEWSKLVDDADSLTPKITELQKKAQSQKRLKKKEQDRLDSLLARRQKKLDKAARIKQEKIDPESARFKSLEEQQLLLAKEIEDQQQVIQDVITRINSREAARKRGGLDPNKMDDGTELPGAFQGDEGAIAAALASSDRTQAATFQWGAGARAEILGSGGDFRRMNPKDLSPKQMETYWAEYVTRVNNRYRKDPLARMVLEGDDIDSIKAWLRSPEGSKYRDELSVSGRQLSDDAKIDTYLSKIVARLDNEVPDVGQLRRLVLDNEISEGQLMAQIGGRELPEIVGRFADEADVNIFAKGFQGLNNITDRAMKWLGTIPENKLLRHPFYNDVYKSRQRDLWRLAREQGEDVTDSRVLARLNKSAHADALKSTRETMYTIERLSNAGEMLRFVSPFFPAWENSMRVFGRMAYQRPQIVGVGNLLWNIPNNLGWVVDENGNKVERSNFLRDEGQYIIWPEPMQKFFEKKFNIGPIPLTPGQAIVSRQSGLNVIFPGGTWWFPGVGPMVTMSTAQILRGKPEDQEILKNFLGEEVYNQVTPFGNVNNSLAESIMPTFARRIKQMLNGETSDGAYLNSYNQILEDAYIQAQIEGRTLTEKDYKEIDRAANNFWIWQVGAAGLLPFQSRQMSKFQLQRDKWSQLIDDESIPYNEKVRFFLEDQGSEFFAGPEFAAITRSGSFSETKLNPNLKTWQRITKNKDLVADLYDIDPELVGMFGNMGSWDDPFSYAVYGEFAQHSPGRDGEPVRRRLRPKEVARNNQIRDGWVAYFKIRDLAEEKALAAGLSSLRVKAAEPLNAILDQGIADIAERYPAWGEERQVYTEKLPLFVLGARKIVQNANVMDEDATVQTLSQYLQVREMISARLAQTNDPDVRNQIREVGYAAAFKLRQQDIGFADFYDQYLARDDFRKV